MTLQDILKEFLVEEDKINSFLGKMKENKIFTASEENLDVRYKKLKDDYDAKDKEHAESLTLIEELKKSSVNNEEMQNKFTDYESKISQLEKENVQIKIDTALKLALQDAGVKKIDYITYQINQQLNADNKSLELDENGHIKGINDLIENQKKIEPEFFISEAKKEVINKELGGQGKEQGNNEPKSLLDALNQHYNPNNE